MHTRIIFIFTLLLFTKITLDAQVLTPEYLWKLGRVNLEDASSDGKYAAYTVAYYDLNENKGKTNLYTVDLMTNQVKILTDVKGNVSNAQYNKDNRIIYFLLDGILNSINTDGSNLQKISDEEMNGFSLSPDNSKILYCKDVKYDNVLGSELYSDLPKSTVRVADGLMYRHWKSWEDGAYSNIFVADIKDNKISVATNIMKNEPYNSPLAPMGGMEQIAWSVDGKKIAYTCKKMRGTASAISTNSDIYIYDLASAATTNLTKGMMGYDTNPTFSPDGKYIAWNSMERPMFEADRNRIFIADLSTNVKEEVTVGVDREANNVIWANDSKTLYYIGGDKATFQIFAIDIKQKQERELTQGDHDYHSMVLA
ncbi:MAG: PD40 domain-containing protein, partial [Saprospiraceae bacterium]|nr:PD40 domain-containing protein [Saprospiraceae bacterium]